MLGAQKLRLNQIRDEYRLNTRAKVQQRDPEVFNLLSNPKYHLPTVLPTGIYQVALVNMKQPTHATIITNSDGEVAVAAQAAAAGITINVPTENTPFAAGATGIDLDGDGVPDGATSSDWFYVFDPTGDVLGGGDGVALCDASHPLTSGGTFANEPGTAADLNETSLEDALISIAGFVDERGLKVALRGMKLILPRQLQFVAERLMVSNLRVGTADNDTNALRSMGMLPQGYAVNDFLTDPDAFFIMTDAPRGMIHFERTALSTNMEADFDTGNMRYKARERYSFGFSDPRCIFGSPGA